MTDWQPLSLALGCLAAVAGYLSGSVPFGLILTRWAGLGDVRSIGSGNIGATNVLRTGNKRIAALTLLCDALKGTLPVLLFTYLGGESAGLVAGFGAFAGHLFPVWLRFKGGKGVATLIGILFGLNWIIGVIFLACWLAMAFTFRISSLAALAAAAVSPFVAYGLGKPALSLPIALLALFIWIMHRANIRRLLSGSEPKINLGARS